MSKPQELNELQVERVMDLWFKFCEVKYGFNTSDKAEIQQFIEWLEGGQVWVPST